MIDFYGIHCFIYVLFIADTSSRSTNWILVVEPNPAYIKSSAKVPRNHCSNSIRPAFYCKFLSELRWFCYQTSKKRKSNQLLFAFPFFCFHFVSFGSRILSNNSIFFFLLFFNISNSIKFYIFPAAQVFFSVAIEVITVENQNVSR